MERTNGYARLVGLSASLPNYQYDATFLRVYEKKGLSYFDAFYFLCGVWQCFTDHKKVIESNQIINGVRHEKLLEQANISLTFAFVHLQMNLAKPAIFIRDTAIEKETITRLS